MPGTSNVERLAESVYAETECMPERRVAHTDGTARKAGADSGCMTMYMAVCMWLGARGWVNMARFAWHTSQEGTVQRQEGLKEPLSSLDRCHPAVSTVPLPPYCPASAFQPLNTITTTFALPSVIRPHLPSHSLPRLSHAPHTSSTEWVFFWGGGEVGCGQGRVSQ